VTARGSSGSSGSSGSLLVVDVGTSGVRASVVRPDGSVQHEHRAPLLPTSPSAGLVEVDARRLADLLLELAAVSLNDAGSVAGVGIANQRATTVVWDRATGEPVAPAIGWQDLRTVGTCLALQADGIRLAPNMSATKLAAILDNVDPSRTRADDLCFGTIDSWVAWTLSKGSTHVTDATNAAVTGLLDPFSMAWDPVVLERLRIPVAMLPRIVDSSGTVGEAAALLGRPPICGIVGDQQASLVGQGCILPGMAKATFGTGGMLDLCTGSDRPIASRRGAHGTFPIVAWQRHGTPVFGVEGIMLSAGTCIEWLRDDIGLIAETADSASVAAQCDDTGDVWFVPALFGIGTPVWDFGARGAFIGITRGTRRAEMVRAVLEGIAHRGADLLEAAESDSAMTVETLRVDGGMSANDVFLSALAEATGRPIEVSPVLEATTLGAGFLAGIATGTWRDEHDAAAAYSPSRTVEPSSDRQTQEARRARWLAARHRATGTVPELSGIEF